MRNLYVLPFDHRASFAKMFGFEYGGLTVEETAALKDYKHLIYEGFLAALKMGVRKEDAAILVDEEFGAEIHEEARRAGITRILTVEKSGQNEFDLEYGEEFEEHVKKINPEYVKALVRYNPRGDKETNRRQLVRLKTLGDFCEKNALELLIELIAVPVDEDLKECGSKENYETDCRWKVMLGAIREFKAAGVEPDIWKLEGLEDEKQFGAVTKAATKSNYSPSAVDGFPKNRPLTGSGDKEIGVIVLGRGESGEKVRRWVSVAAKIPSVIGFAVGRTVWIRPLLEFASKKSSRVEAAERIAKNYKGFVEIFERARN